MSPLADTNRSTPTPSECDEAEDVYQEVWYFWIEVQFKQVSKKRYNTTATRFDRCPLSSAYFRELCLYDLVVASNGLFTIELSDFERRGTA
jgi:hypothetical protein